MFKFKFGHYDVLDYFNSVVMFKKGIGEKSKSENTGYIRLQATKHVLVTTASRVFEDFFKSGKSKYFKKILFKLKSKRRGTNGRY